MMLPSEILCQAKSLITPSTWYCEGQAHGRQWKVGQCQCVGTAIEHADDRDESHESEHEAFSFFRRANELGERSIMDWNDDEARTLGQVYDAFDKAIALAVGSSR